MSGILGFPRRQTPLKLLYIFSVCLCLTVLGIAVYFTQVDTWKHGVYLAKNILHMASFPRHSGVYYTENERPLGLPKINANSPLITILWINKPIWFSLEMSNDCPYTNCIMTDTVENIESKSAIVFSAQDQLNESLFQRDKPEDQVWIFLRMEPPPNAKHAKWIKQPIWRNKMNWSWGYRLGSDIFRPYQQLIPRNTYPDKNYGEIFRRKNKVAAWVVSHCRTQSRREEYVRQLKQYGLPVDIYGRCSPEGRKETLEFLEEKIAKDYKFFLSFENSLCKDYVTEKFFKYYDLDVVSVTRGGINYTHHFDGTTFINAADFPSAKELADFILKVNSNEALYTDYLRNKDKYEPISRERMWQISKCKLCVELNKKVPHNKVYNDMSTFLFKDACFSPNDL